MASKNFNHQNQSTNFWSDVKVDMYKNKKNWEEIKAEWQDALDEAQERVDGWSKLQKDLKAGAKVIHHDLDDCEFWLKTHKERIEFYSELVKLENPFH